MYFHSDGKQEKNFVVQTNSRQKLARRRQGGEKKKGSKKSEKARTLRDKDKNAFQPTKPNHKKQHRK